jgi:hypothetical protein
MRMMCGLWSKGLVHVIPLGFMQKVAWHTCAHACRAIQYVPHSHLESTIDPIDLIMCLCSRPIQLLQNLDSSVVEVVSVL